MAADPAACTFAERGGHFCPPRIASLAPERLGLDDGDDLEVLRIDHDDLVADQDELVAAPFRIDRHDFAPAAGGSEPSRGTRVPTEIVKFTLVVA